MTVEDGLRLAKLAEDAAAELASPGPYPHLPASSASRCGRTKVSAVLDTHAPAEMAAEVWQEAAYNLCHRLQESLGVHVVQASCCKGGVPASLEDSECSCQFGLCRHMHGKV